MSTFLPTRRAGALLAAGGVALAIAGCSSDEGGGSPPPPAPPEADVVEAVPFASTRLLPPEALGSLEPPAPDGTLVFAAAPAALDAVRPGEVLVGGASAATPAGLLRGVTKVERDGARLKLATVVVPVQFAFRKVHARLRGRAADTGGGRREPGGQLAPLAEGSGGDGLALDVAVFDGDKDPSTAGDQVYAKGEIAGRFSYSLGFDVDWGAVDALPELVTDCLLQGFSDCEPNSLVPEAKVGFSVQGDARASLTLEGSAFVGFSKDVHVTSVYLDPISAGPLVFTPVIEVDGHVEGGASSRFKVTTGAAADFGVALEASSKSGVTFEPPSSNRSFTPPEADVVLGASAEVGVTTSLHVRLYGVAGPYAGLTAYTKIEANPDASPCWVTGAGVEATFGADIAVSLPGAGKFTLVDKKLPVPIYEGELASGACELPAGVSTLPPGSGPDGTTLAAPTFTPWSRTYAAQDAFNYPNGADAYGLSWTDLHPTIDGNYLVTGEANGAVVKVNPAGEPVWALRYEFDGDADGGRRRTFARAANAADAGLVVATSPYGLLKLGQGGGVEWARSFDLPRAEQTGIDGNSNRVQHFSALVEDGAGGFFVVGNATAPTPPGGEAPLPALWALRVDGRGEVLWSRRLEDPAAGIYPAAAVAAPGGGLTVVGTRWTAASNAREAFVVRLDGAGELARAERLWRQCGDEPREGMYPTAVLDARDGSTVVAGNGGGFLTSFFLSLKPDGGAGNFTVPWAGSDLDYMVIHSIAELPTGGFVAAGGLAFSDTVIGGVPSAPFVASLDAVGQVRWVRRYRLAPDDGLLEASAASLHLTDDGGALVAAKTGAPGGDGLWALKVHAKDGAIAFAPGGPAVDDGPVAMKAACVPSVEPWAPQAAPFAVAARSLGATARPVALAVARQTSP